MFGWEFPPHISGGLGTASFGLTKAMHQLGTDIIFVVPKLYGDEDSSMFTLQDADSVEYRHYDKEVQKLMEKIQYLEIESSLVPYLDPEQYERFLHDYEERTVKNEKYKGSTGFQFSGKYGVNLIDEVNRYAFVAGLIASKQEFDLIHAHDWLTFSAGIAAKEISGKPLVIHVHATEYDRSGENVNQAVFKIEKRGMERADRIITVSKLTRNTLVDKYKINPKKIVTVYNAVEQNETQKQISSIKGVNEKIVTFLGRITFQKGPEYFIEAARKVLKVNPNVRFVMAGSGDMYHGMIERVAQLGIADRFHFTGFLRGDDVIKMYQLSDVYVMPSVSEPFGISPLEAMRSNVPVIISKQSGVSEVLKHAIKIDFWDVDALADSIHAMLNYTSISEMFSRLGKEEVETFKWENSANKVLDVYDTLGLN